ncbi:hypothetical protein Lepto7376_0847 [[Leptolyngbya] sp. PCC 7376]|uniref:hypothetical protein n=1 Tax=[Leptolyngbya] sp. PCC 7376 TaxID=111781 RepID=UPI00029EF92F|nr:hypothetical protein [[Leptolyngbya] sp. PCC 7376]AFY37242.1 hypothetical protein Lepto7376_0847 [[Leptolyngbya] sp. PCC 7376]
MSLGSLRLKFQEKFGHGLSVAYYRDIVRPKILGTRPITETTDTSCELHVMTSQRDWLNLMWSIKSFYVYSGRQYGLCIHDDGSLTSEMLAAFCYHFPNARVIERHEADAFVLPQLKDYPNCLKFRETNHLSPKVFDFRAYLNADRMLLFDSDLIFFAEPKELLERIENPEYKLNSVNGDVSNAYTIDPAVVKEKAGFEVINRFNSGLGLIHKESLNLDWLEEFLQLPDAIGHFWRIEQTMYALCSSKFGTELLPKTYDVHLEGDRGQDASRHYVGAIRHLMYSEGIKQLAKQGFLQQLVA